MCRVVFWSLSDEALGCFAGDSIYKDARKNTTLWINKTKKCRSYVPLKLLQIKWKNKSTKNDFFFLNYAVLPHYKKHFFEDTTSQDLNKCLIEVFASINFDEFSHRSVGKVSATALEFKSGYIWSHCKFLLNLKFKIFFSTQKCVCFAYLALLLHHAIYHEVIFCWFERGVVGHFYMHENVGNWSLDTSNHFLLNCGVG